MMASTHLHKALPMLLPKRSSMLLNTRTMAASSAAAVLLVGSFATSIIAIRRRALRRRGLRYRIGNTARRAIHAGLKGSIKIADRVSATLGR
jgi:hypothetical protein